MIGSDEGAEEVSDSLQCRPGEKRRVGNRIDGGEDVRFNERECFLGCNGKKKGESLKGVRQENEIGQGEEGLELRDEIRRYVGGNSTVLVPRGRGLRYLGVGS